MKILGHGCQRFLRQMNYFDRERYKIKFVEPVCDLIASPTQMPSTLAGLARKELNVPELKTKVLLSDLYTVMAMARGQMTSVSQVCDTCVTHFV